MQVVAVTAEFLVDSINGVTETGHISKEFVGIILLPIVGNAAGVCCVTLSLSHSFLTFLVFLRARNSCHCIGKGQAKPQSRCGGWIEYCKHD